MNSKIIKIANKYFVIYKDGMLIDLKAKKKKPFSKNQQGYLKVAIWDSLTKKNVMKYQHQLIAKAFIPNPEKKPMIDHLNGNVADNRIENLRWVNNSENIQAAYDNGQIKKKRPL